MSFRDELERLVRLQAAEIQVRGYEARIDGLPAAREACQVRVHSAEDAVKAAEGDRDASQAEQRRREGELQAAEAQIDKYREQEMQVKTNQQLWAIQDEITTVQDRIGRIEGQILEQLEAADGLGEAIKQRQGELGVAKIETAAEVAVIDASERDLKDSLAAERTVVEQIRGETDPKPLKLYDRVASVRGGIAIAEGVEGRCMACNVRLRPQIWVQVLRAAEPQQCDACKRIVFVREALSLPSSVSVDALG
jgi:predicted  nucleic acid-binding Zn-ribbon protein